MQSGNWKGNFMSDDNNTMLEAKKAVEALNAGFEAFKHSVREFFFKEEH